MGLLATWLLFAIAALVWWRRRHSSKKYSFTERAQVILEAIQAKLDVGIIYWSKHENKFLRRVVTPEELDGYSLRGFDHTLKRTRVFKVTRIRLIELIPQGAVKRAPSRMKLVSVPTVAATGLGGIALVLLALALIRGQGPPPLTGIIAPPLVAPGIANPLPAVITTAATDTLQIADAKLISTTKPPAEVDPDDFLNAPIPTVTPAETWYLVVESHPKYKQSQVATTLQTILRYRPDRAIELEQSVMNLGRAVVWSGPKKRAERFQQLLEGYDILAKIEPATSATNAVSTKTP